MTVKRQYNHNAGCRFAECRYAGCRYAGCRYAGCRYAECHYAECHGACSYPYECTMLALNVKETTFSKP